MPTEVSVILPALNEEKTVGKTVECALEAFPEGETIVADSGSCDKTMEIAERKGANVVSARPGKGNAMRAGFLKSKGKTLVFFDSDIRNISPKMIADVAKPVLGGLAEMSIGSFASPFPQTFTELVYRPLVKLAFPEVEGRIPLNPLSGQRAFGRKTFKTLENTLETGFGAETGINIDFVIKRLGRISYSEIGRIDPVFKGRLSEKNVLEKKAEEIATAIIRRAKREGKMRLGHLGNGSAKYLLKGSLSAIEKNI